MKRLNADLKYRKMLDSAAVSEILGYHVVHTLKLARDFEKGKPGIFSQKYRGKRYFREEDLESYIDYLNERERFRGKKKRGEI